MINLKQNTLKKEIPQNLVQDDKVARLADSLERSVSKATDWAYKINYTMDLANVDDEILDYLLWEFSIGWNEGLALVATRQEKINLIESAIELHRLKGTPAAIEKVLSALNLNGEVLEWFNYGGDPYFFRVEVDMINIVKGTIELLKAMISEFKNTRSWLEYVAIKMKQTNLLKLTHFNYRYPIYYHKCGDLITAPILGMGIGSIVGVSDSQYRYPVYYNSSDTFNTAPLPGASLKGTLEMFEGQYDYPNYYRSTDTFNTEFLPGVSLEEKMKILDGQYDYPNYYPVVNVVESEDFLNGVMTGGTAKVQQKSTSMRMMAPICGIFSGGGM